MLSLRVALAVSAAGLAACAGVTEEQFNALASQVKQMQTAVAETGEPDPKIATLDQRLGGFEATTSERIKKLEEMIEFLQRELAKAAAATPAAGGDSWAVADTILGIDEEGVTAAGDSYTIKASWLGRAAEAQAANAKGLKFTDGKEGGVRVAGVKPGSLLDRLGLKNGDLITAVNGAAVASVAELAVALRQGKNPTTVTLSRKKKDQTLTYTLGD